METIFVIHKNPENISKNDEEHIKVNIPLSCLNSFNKIFMSSKNTEEDMLESSKDNYNKSVTKIGNNKEREIEILVELEEYVKNIVSNILKDNDNKKQVDNMDKNNIHPNNISDDNNDEYKHYDENNKTEEKNHSIIPKNIFEYDAVDMLNEKYEDILWKKRCNKKKEILEILKMHGYIEKENNTDNNLKDYYNNLIEQYINDEKSFNKQLKQISDLKNNYDMHLSNITLRKSKFVDILEKTKNQITLHFKNMLKRMNNYKGKIEFDDINRNLKVLISINQDTSNNVFMEINSLSGGERSTIQMALLASFSLTESSSFHIFDELDVYMDELTRVKNMRLFCDFVEKNNDKQYFFITPHIEITELFLDDAKQKKAKILNLS
ncbi:hypothetical protein PFBG_01146 [Plasmodium falciparum 7G8]|nr:hypothetical protein PFBG_01146 [Plasmodium falciparum 7G8]